MKIAILTSGDPIALAIVADLQQCHVVHHYQEKIPTRQSLMRPLKRRQHRLITRFSRVTSLLVFGVLYKFKIEKRLKKYCQVADATKADLIVSDVNSHDVFLQVVRIKPDLIMTVGVSVLKKRWTDLSTPIINLHTGLLPFYRGRFCWFWPLLDKNLEMLGVSVHRLVSAIDAGEMYEFSPLSLRHQHEDAITNLFLSLADAHKSAVHNFLNSDRKQNQSPAIDVNYQIKFEPRITELIRGLYTLKKSSTQSISEISTEILHD